MPFRIVVLGGYGQFGGRISRALAGERQVELIVAGRGYAAAAAFIGKLDGTVAHCEPIVLDHAASDFPTTLRELRPNLVVHTSGPFQGQSYHVARAAIDTGAHYLDLADGRAFVSGITSLDSVAREKAVVVASGASTLPAVSSAVIEHLRPAFAQMRDVEITIAPGQKTPRGVATMESILSYCGRPFLEWNDGAWRRVHGWQGLRRFRHPELGVRWAARCDVPDLDLLPVWYPALRSARFDASLELSASHIGLWMLAWLVRAGLIRRPETCAEMLLRLARMMDGWGTNIGGMHVGVTGTDAGGKSIRRDWYVKAGSGHGPDIPCIPAIVIAKKLARGESIAPGARPCHGMMTLEEFDTAVRHLHICWHVFEQTAS
ncbi:MAG TPA: saccharopine dehydrogenase NADP-binding domain-containing protein [Casimicrobiaceae bacterium]|jgi:saccharopine dehydrogenase-like NADP-dependent oxidoreductase|nr:saccharopine dehydrogenase NADP-binding domain-containing protein [Casimicrobiaceae bacterium]